MFPLLINDFTARDLFQQLCLAVIGAGVLIAGALAFVGLSIRKK